MSEYSEGVFSWPDMAAELMPHMVSFNPIKANSRVSHSFLRQKSWDLASLCLAYKPSGCD